MSTMNNNNLRKRRSYGQEDAPVVPKLKQPPTLPSSSSSISSPPSAIISLPDLYSGHELHILQQAASILKCSESQLIALSHPSHSPHLSHHRHPPYYHHSPHHHHQQQQGLLRLQHQDTQSSSHQHQPQHQYKTEEDQYTSSPVSYHHYNNKRLRLTTDVATMPSHQEKSSSPRAFQHGGHDHTRADVTMAPARSFSLGIDGSQLAQCFSACMSCGPSDPPTYSAVPVATSFGYTPLPTSMSPYCDEKASSPPAPSSAVPPEQPNALTGDEAALVPANMSNYPVLQPGRPMAVQPSTRGEGMIYSPFSTTPAYLSRAEQASAIPRHPLLAGEPTSQSNSAPSYITPDSEVVEGTSQSRELDIVLPNQRAPPTKRGPFKNNQDREKTAETRKIGSCIRCRMQRIRCEINLDDKNGACLTCMKISNTKIWRLPCLRYKITDVKLFKPGQIQGHEWTRRWMEGEAGDISHWASLDTKSVEVTEGYTNTPVRLRVRQFVPQDGDSLERTWVFQGERRNVVIPAYAIINLDDAKRAYDEYIKRGVRECCKSILERKEPMLYATYRFALRAASDPNTTPKEKDLLTKALQLWMAVRLTTKSTVIVGNETLGMTQDIMDTTSPLHGQIPLPPVMGAQIELVLIHQIQANLRRDMLDNLQTMTQANKHQTWWTTYLVTFILLHNVSLLCQHDAGYARKHGIQRRFARVEMVREYQLGANILLAYFHYCNKGIYPFSAECKQQDLTTLAELDETRIRYLELTRNAVEKNRKQWAKVRDENDYENDFYFISQLYEENWMPRPLI